MAFKREKVAIVGGGVAGLSAAHELVERGFDVEIYERREFYGGKAASYRVAPTPTLGAAGGRGLRTKLLSNEDASGLPGEHGFRFVPGWYRHLTHTLARIPYHESGGGVNTVAENLVSVRSNLLAWFDRSPVLLPLRVPGTIAEATATSRFIKEFSGLGLTAAETALFVSKLVELLLMTEERRIEQLEGVSWWDYLECSSPKRSRAFVEFVKASTRTSVAAKAEEVSAYTVGRLVVRTLLDTVGAVDQVFDGPTSEAWIDPWVSFLTSRGVEFFPNMELSSIALKTQTSKVESVTLEPVSVSCVRRLRNRLDEVEKASRKSQVPDSRLVDEVDELIEQLVRLLGEKHTVSKALKPSVEGGVSSQLSELKQIQDALEDYWNDEASAERLSKKVDAEYFVLALPLEQLAYYVNRSTMLTHLAPELRRVVPLSREMDWMAGIQFYLRTPLDVAPGHLVGLDSEWALTAVEQTRFWDDVGLPPGVKGILSVDIGAWDKKGRKVRKEAFNCTDQEIAEEVWAELEEMLNRPGRSPVLGLKMLLGGALARNDSYHLDDSIIDLRDRKKQASYERSRGLVLGAVDEQKMELGTDKVVENYMWGAPRRRYNAEPLLINRPGSRQLRPEATTAIANLFLAGDYIKTETDLACMEGANEAARRAVNGILDAAGSREERCGIWPFSPSRQAIEAVTSVSAPLQAVRGLGSVVTSLRDKVWKGLSNG